MARIYPKHAVPQDCTAYEYEEFNDLDFTSCSNHWDPTGLDEVETYTDLYNVPHGAPKRAKY